MRSLVIPERLRAQPLLLQLERSQPGHLPLKLFQQVPPGEGPWADEGHTRGTTSPGWPVSASGFPPAELEDVSRESLRVSAETADPATRSLMKQMSLMTFTSMSAIMTLNSIQML